MAQLARRLFNARKFNDAANYPSTRLQIMVAAYRDWTILGLIETMLIQTGQFDLVTRRGLPADRGIGSEMTRAAFLQMAGSLEFNLYDNVDGSEQVRTVKAICVLAVRIDDPLERDSEADRLGNLIANTIGGESLGGETVPSKTMVTSTAWQKEMSSERRLVLTIQWVHLIDAFKDHNTDKE